MNTFTLKDMKAGAFNRPFSSVNAATAIREIEHSVQDGQNPFIEDMALYQTGTFDPETGRTEGLPEPKHILDLKDLVVEENDQNITLDGDKVISAMGHA